MNRDDGLDASCSSISRISQENDRYSRRHSDLHDMYQEIEMNGEYSGVESEEEDENYYYNTSTTSVEPQRKKRRMHRARKIVHRQSTRNDQGISRNTAVSVAGSESNQLQEELIAKQREKDVAEMKKVYEENDKVKFEQTTLRDVKCATRDYLVSKVKFVDTGKKKGFPTYFKHDFTNQEHFITKFVTDYCGLKKGGAADMARFWNTYAKTIKKQFANHRSTFTCSMKNDFINGKRIHICVSIFYNETNWSLVN